MSVGDTVVRDVETASGRRAVGMINKAPPRCVDVDDCVDVLIDAELLTLMSTCRC
jgi:hypothetical protein